MGNNLARVFVVFTAVASLSFLAFAGSLTLGGTNWVGLLNSEPIFKLYSWTKKVDQPEYDLYSRNDTKSLVKAKTPAALVVKARQDMVKNLTEERQKLSTQMEKDLAEAKSFNEAVTRDLQGIKLREASLLKQMEDVTAKLEQSTQQLADTGEQVQFKRLENEEVRTEVYRLRNQLELLRDDLYAIATQRDVLQDELLSLQESLGRLRVRNAQLKSVKDNYNQ